MSLHQKLLDIDQPLTFEQNKLRQIEAHALIYLSTFYTSHLRWNSNMRRCFYHTDLRQNAVFHNFSRQIALIQYSEPYEALVGF